MQAIMNLLNWLNENWIELCIAIGLGVAIGKSLRQLIKMDDEQRAEYAKNAVSQTILKSVAKTEIEYNFWNKSGRIKRAQVIEEIFKTYPILTRFADQDEFMAWLDQEIDNSLKVLKETMEQE